MSPGRSSRRLRSIHRMFPTPSPSPKVESTSSGPSTFQPRCRRPRRGSKKKRCSDRGPSDPSTRSVHAGRPRCLQRSRLSDCDLALHPSFNESAPRRELHRRDRSRPPYRLAAVTFDGPPKQWRPGSSWPGKWRPATYLIRLPLHLRSPGAEEGQVLSGMAYKPSSPPTARGRTPPPSGQLRLSLRRARPRRAIGDSSRASFE